MDLNIKRKERKVLNSSLYSSTHRNARTIKLVSLRVRRIRKSFFVGASVHMGFIKKSYTLPSREEQREMLVVFISDSFYCSNCKINIYS